MTKNINTNTAIANIILSDNHEIRLKKKKTKKNQIVKKKKHSQMLKNNYEIMI